MLKNESYVYRFREKARSAFWGAAAGDALGWPQEMPNRRIQVGRSQSSTRVLTFSEWRRRSGGRFLPHEEVIRAGEYSDDTQLILCSARSILTGSGWLRHFVEKELPGWAIYQRGGGGATKRAVELWLKGAAPWTSTAEDKGRYFDAGGNGVAMRILPHAIYGARQDSFAPTAKAILLNGICTHGHPRALIGALCFGYIAWEAARFEGTLPYGYLLKAAISNAAVWSSLPRDGRLLATWAETADDANRGNLESSWSNTTAEMISLLRRAASGIDAGSLSIDSQVLSALGCFDHSKSGAGTVCAAAAAYLASKYAPDPQHGALEASFALGADTDTLSSMASSLLGAVSGSEWLLRLRDSLQDEEYIGGIADQICEAEPIVDIDENIQELSPKRAIKDAVITELLASHIGSMMTLPDGRSSEVQLVENLSSSSRISARQWKLRTIDGQTIYVKQLSRTRQDTGNYSSLTGEQSTDKRAMSRSSSKVQAIKLPVEDIERSRRFYGEVLGLRVTRQSKNSVNFGGIVTLVPVEYIREIDALQGGRSSRSIICIETKRIDYCYEQVRRDASARCTPFFEKAGRRLFRCVDPDHNVIEVFEAVQKSSHMDQQQELL